MAEVSINGNSAHTEDVLTLMPGTTLVDHPCVVWNIVITNETGEAIVSFSNSSGYNSTYRKLKVIANKCLVVTFPKGLYLSTALSVISNIDSTDISVVYD